MQSVHELKIPSTSAPQEGQTFPRIIGIRIMQSAQNIFAEPSNGTLFPQSGQGSGIQSLRKSENEFPMQSNKDPAVANTG